MISRAKGVSAGSHENPFLRIVACKACKSFAAIFTSVLDGYFSLVIAVRKRADCPNRYHSDISLRLPIYYQSLAAPLCTIETACSLHRYC